MSVDASTGGGTENAVAGGEATAAITLEHFIDKLSSEAIEVPYLWSPWWTHPDDATPSALEMTAHVRSVQRISPNFAFVELTIDLRDVDGRFAISAQDRAFVERDVFVEGFSMNIRFDDPGLADALSLPPAADRFDAADPFNLRVALGPDGFRVALGSRRQDNDCTLFEPPPATLSASPQCEPYAPELRQLTDRRIEASDIAAVVIEGIAPSTAVDALHALGPFAIEWRADDVAELELEIVPHGFACVSRGSTPPWRHADIAPPADYPEGEWEVEVLVPVTFQLASADARLLADMPGRLSFTVTERDGWNGHVDGYAGLLHARRLLRSGGRPGFALPPGVIPMLSFSLNAPFDSQLSLRDFIPFPGVPEYPDVIEPSSSRVSCFGQRGAWRRAEIAAR